MNVNNINKIDKHFFKPVFDKKYVDCRRKECPQLYNEIYKYLKSEDIPKRLISPFMKNVEAYWKKKQNNEKIEDIENPYINKNNLELDYSKKAKRRNFRDIIKNKYIIKDDRLYYKYTRCKGKTIEKKIPFTLELPYIFFSAHVSISKSMHFSINKSKENILNCEYYYEGITKDLLSYIQTCPKCNGDKNLKNVKRPMKIIIEEGPHFRVQMDIWYINEDIAKICGYNYLLDIIDVFSKFVFSYLFINKTAEEVLSH